MTFGAGEAVALAIATWAVTQRCGITQRRAHACNVCWAYRFLIAIVVAAVVS